MGYIELSNFEVALAGLLILINGGISVWLRLGLERSLLIASLRTVIQLMLVGLVLQWVFHNDEWPIVVALMIFMTIIAGFTAGQRSERRYAGVLIDTLLSVWVSSWAITAFALFAVMSGTEKWYQPQYAIPLLGMVLGNTLNGISLGLSTYTDSLVRGRREIESSLSLGASRWEAALPATRHALRTGMTPIINSMMIVGLVSLPGMMTGQLLAGTSPLQAIRYQIVIMFLIASGTALGTTGIVLLSFLRLFNSDHQFLRDKLEQAPDS